MTETQARQVVAEVLNRIAPGSDLAAVDPHASLRRELDLDSLDFLAYVEGLSARCGRDVPEVDYPVVDTAAGAVAFVVGAHTDAAPHATG